MPTENPGQERRKKVAILGSTGSIGTQTLDIIRQQSEWLEVVGLAAGKNAQLLSEQAREFGVKSIALFTNATGSGIPYGMEALTKIATQTEADIVVVAVAGVIGLLPTMAAIEAGKEIALASKEVLVAAGEIVMPAVRRHGVKLTPIDSEHSAIFQCLQGVGQDQIDSLILTASGGPFRGRRKSDLENISVEDALNHPTWRMGGKITIDSATLMNKGLEIIEAKWLFDIPADSIQVLVHPQSIIHSMVRLTDGSVLAQLGNPDMRLPISYALLHPERKVNQLPSWNPFTTPNLSFEPADESTFDALKIAREAIKLGGTVPCCLNAANEEAANAFLKGRIPFTKITEIVKRVIDQHQSTAPTLESLLETDANSRAVATSLIESV